MSFNENDTISLSNYEEWLILYMDNELSAKQQKEVESFLLLHPHLQEEMDLLLGTKLPAEPLTFSGKEDLQASAMRLNVVDESLLLYLDNELPAAEKRTIEEKIFRNNDVRQQYDLLQQTKLDASESIPYPNKQELYRRSDKVRPLFPVWMRIAAAVVLLMFGSYLFLFDNPAAPPAAPGYVAVSTPPATKVTLQRPAEKAQETAPTQQTPIVVNATPGEGAEKKIEKAMPGSRVKENVPVQELASVQPAAMATIQRADVIQLEIEKLATQPVTALNKSMTNLSVTSVSSLSYNLSDNPEESIVTDGENKPARTPAKGFLRKVSRFIERRTGIGTVNADNELLVGAVALKLN